MICVDAAVIRAHVPCPNPVAAKASPSTILFDGQTGARGDGWVLTNSDHSVQVILRRGYHRKPCQREAAVGKGAITQVTAKCFRAIRNGFQPFVVSYDWLRNKQHLHNDEISNLSTLSLTNLFRLLSSTSSQSFLLHFFLLL